MYNDQQQGFQVCRSTSFFQKNSKVCIAKEVPTFFFLKYKQDKNISHASLSYLIISCRLIRHFVFSSSHLFLFVYLLPFLGQTLGALNLNQPNLFITIIRLSLSIQANNGGTMGGWLV